MDFGAFMEILPGKEGLCHISKLSRNGSTMFPKLSRKEMRLKFV